MYYTTREGRVIYTRPLGIIKPEERNEIFEFYKEHGCYETRMKFDVSHQTLEHIKYAKKKQKEVKNNYTRVTL